MKDLKGKYGEWALVTGASDGIGQAFTEYLAKHQMNLILVARSGEKLMKLAARLNNEQGISVKTIVADLGNETEATKVLAETSSLDVGLYVGAAGFGTSGNFGESELHDEVNMLDVNCRTVLTHSHHFLRRFTARSKGGIILFSSIVAFQGVPRSANYAASKAYVQTLAEGLYREARGHNVDVLAVAPGPVKSGFAHRARLVMGGADTPESVVHGAINALGNSATVRTGFLGKALGYSLSLLPRSLRTLIMTQVMASMTRHQIQGGRADGVV